ncbi:MAG: hypothetical protein JWR21_901 [Herminiimonas sp.]|nr:hypothetical protein [Herminiimonas sp.]
MAQSFDWHLENWIRWCRGRGWLPAGYVSQLGVMTKQAKQESISATDVVTPVFEESALSFNELIMMLPRRHMSIFLLNHLDKGVLGQMIVYKREANSKFALAGMTKTTFYRRAAEADSMIKRWME